MGFIRGKFQSVVAAVVTVALAVKKINFIMQNEDAMQSKQQNAAK